MIIAVEENPFHNPINRTRPMTSQDAQANSDFARNTKRRCNGFSDTNNIENAMIVSRDCYDQVMACADSAVPFHQDWFYQVPHMTKERLLQQHQPIQQEDSLESLDGQLQQVKRRFGPAAERCADAVHQSGLFQTQPHQEFELARRACNPYEVLGETRQGGLNHGLFLNRSAIKLANIDAQLDFGLLLHSSNNNNNLPFTFVDLCAAPGGFSEYILRRFCHNITTQQQQGQQQQSCRGFGMSLQGNNEQGHGTEWKLSDGPILLGRNQNGPSVHYHICTGADGTGDIFQWHNVQALQQMIAKHTKQQQQPLVHLVLADGGVDAQRNVAHPEGETQKLVVCQTAAALSMLQPGGRFILKLLSCQTTPVLQSVLHELLLCFDSIAVLKPISSRPASAERYLVCSGFQGNNNNNNNDPFDGPRWISRVLLGQRPVPPALVQWLARIDRDMIHLNLKACFKMLSHLESKTIRLASDKAAERHGAVMADTATCMEQDDDDEAWIAQGYQIYQEQKGQHSNLHQLYYEQQSSSNVNVEDYRMAWRLF
ncbi:specific mRNA (nucleoside-2'-O-)-methyltransferase 1 [Seminavis robusta]|uniref:Cap-specific mRNA (nucleoside-2'-O-)-methyltransferase 1 n=1 Tax=Seminavis robusta TaxID=568900 RepID=A0A9N8DAV0_9STRA|nr:specific mRNA (nucleoside-2'-O-)-methyltransferase 1 [Seminavis robusta]|eukprot:Sro65_g036590.1 specific mRNA (nucleoside-2'-O-)-methyltransferase 1 (541) ;mRNA; r:22952-24574